MKKVIWNLIALFLTNHSSRVDWLIAKAQRYPYFHLEGYMDRWWLLPGWALGTDEYGNLWPKKWVPFSMRIHHIKREDSGRDLHDHPFDYRTIILRGAYIEEDIFGDWHNLYSGDTQAKRAQHFHRIVAVTEGGVWTLFILGPHINRWGFLVGGRKVYWKDYASNP